MAFPTVASVNEGANAVNGTPQVINLPSGRAPGDRIIAALSKDGNGNGIWPLGWILIDEDVTAANKLEAYYRDWTGSETPGEGSGGTIEVNTPTEMSAHGSARIAAGTFNPAAAPIALSANGNSQFPSPPDLTMGSIKDWLVLVIAGHDDGTRTFTEAPLVELFTDMLAIAAVSSQGAGIAMARANVAASTVAPGSFTLNTTDTWAAITIAIEPAAGGGETPVSRSLAVRTESLGRVARSSGARWENTGATIPVITRLQPTAYSGRQYGAFDRPAGGGPVAGSLTLRMESIGRVARAPAPRWESLLRVARAPAPRWENRSALVTVVRALASRWESRARVARAPAPPWSSVGRIVRALSPRWESLLRVLRAPALRWESRPPVVARSLPVPWEATSTTVLGVDILDIVDYADTVRVSEAAGSVLIDERAEPSMLVERSARDVE